MRSFASSLRQLKQACAIIASMRELSYTLFKNEYLLSVILECLIGVALIWLLFNKVVKWKEKKEVSFQTPLSFVKTPVRGGVLRKKDWFYISIVTLCYAIISLTSLGSDQLPSTTWQPAVSNQSVVFELTEGTRFDAVYTIYGEGDNNNNLETWQLGTHNLLLEGSNDGITYETITTISEGSIYQYHIFEGDWDYRYVRLTSYNTNDTLSEIGFKTYGEESFLPVKVTSDDYATSTYPATLLIDEQSQLTLYPTCYDEGYFDEIYHPRNAWEIANGQYMYSSVHPLLGTCFIALSIKLFGLSPFAWRLPGALFGIFLVPLFYKILKLLFHNRSVCLFGTVLLATDFMHITTSRIGTLEPMSVFWILLMFRYMIEYCQSSFYFDSPKYLHGLLLKCGIAMGCGIATKWTACYSAVGLAILLFTNWFVRIREYRKACLYGKIEGISEQEKLACLEIQSKFKHLYSSFGMCFVYFILIPVIIYFVSYIPCHVTRDGWSVSNVLGQIEYMYNYHINLEATHPYQSTWYQWIFDIRPIWYYGREVQGKYYSIVCFSNPVTCWIGVITILYTLIRTITKRDRNGWIIVIGYLTALLPWVLVKRCVFAYHFYPTSFFMILSIAYLAKDIYRLDTKAGKIVMGTISVGATLLFILFMPVLCGFATSNAYVKFLEWLPTWYFG